MIRVYAWPPVGVVGTEWSETSPVRRSRSLLTGADYISTTQRRRRVVTLEVSSLARGRSGAGYSEALKRLLQGGVNAVRLHSYPINWYLDALRNDFQSAPLSWTTNGDDLGWEANGSELLWFTGPALQGTVGTEGGWDVVTVTGAPANTLLVRPGDFVRIYGAEVGVAQVVTEARSDANGDATIRLFEPLPNDGTLSLGDRESIVARPESIPRAVQPVSGNWTYEWQFREIFADEVGGFEEVDPWN